jgi:hypothetical protein
MNHLEQLVAEWLQYNKFFVRMSVPVGPLAGGGFEGELDVVAFEPVKRRFLHVECSLDADSAERREVKFAGKFERGRKYARNLFDGMPLPDIPEQILVLQFASGLTRMIGGARLVTVREFVHEMFDGLKGTSPARKAVPSTLPLLRTVQLVADGVRKPTTSGETILPPRLPDGA